MSVVEHEFAGRDGLALVVRPRGPVGQAAVGPLTACVERWAPNADGGGVVIDFSEVAFVSSVGVATLLQIAELCRERGLWMRLVGLRKDHEALLAMLELEGKFAVAGTVEEALGAEGV